MPEPNSSAPSSSIILTLEPLASGVTDTDGVQSLSPCGKPRLKWKTEVVGGGMKEAKPSSLRIQPTMVTLTVVGATKRLTMDSPKSPTPRRVVVLKESISLMGIRLAVTLGLGQGRKGQGLGPKSVPVRIPVRDG